MTRLLFTGATVWAGATCTPRPAWLLVEDDRVAALGEHEQPPPADDVLDLVGCHVLPGFVDVHLHLSQAAWFPHGGDGMAWGSLAEARHAIRVAADAAPTGPWLLFWRVPRFAWPEGRLPTARELDEAAPGRRVLVSTLDMHRGALSSAGLAALGVADQRAGQFGDEVTRDRRGRPTGEVWEAAYGIALQRALADTAAQHGEQGAAAVLAAEADRFLAYGITHAHDPYVSPDLHQRMCALHATSPMRLSWATGSPAGMLSRPPGPNTAPDGPYGDAGREVKLFADGGERAAAGSVAAQGDPATPPSAHPVPALHRHRADRADGRLRRRRAAAAHPRAGQPRRRAGGPRAAHRRRPGRHGHHRPPPAARPGHRRPCRGQRGDRLLPARLHPPLRRHDQRHPHHPAPHRVRRPAAAAGRGAAGAQLRLPARRGGPAAQHSRRRPPPPTQRPATAARAGAHRNRGRPRGHRRRGGFPRCTRRRRPRPRRAGRPGHLRRRPVPTPDPGDPDLGRRPGGMARPGPAAVTSEVSKCTAE